MTDLASLGSSEPLSSAPLRDRAFRAAGRHTVRVRILRVVMILASLIGVAAVVGFAFLNQFRMSIPSVSIDSVGLNGTKITMDKPKLEGFRSDGRPYSVNAKTAVQDARQPNVLELHEIDGHVTMGDKSVVHVVSTLAIYDSSKETMRFDHDVRLTSDSGLDAQMKAAYIEFKTGIVDTRDPVTVVMNGGTVSADTMHIVDNGKAATFEGHVHSTMLSSTAMAQTKGSLKGSAP